MRYLTTIITAEGSLKMNHYEKRNTYLLSVLCMLLGASFIISEPSYSHDIPVPFDITSSDGTIVELVTHKDLYDSDGNFVAHIHDYSTSSYTQAEVDEIHANNPHTRQSVIDGLPKAGDVKGVHGRSYNNPGFTEPDDLSAVGTPDPTYEDYGIAGHLPDPPNSQGDAQSPQNAQADPLSPQATPISIQESQENPPAIQNQEQTITATHNGQQQNFVEIAEPESSEDGLYAIIEGEAIEESQLTPQSQDDGRRYRLLSSLAVRGPTRQLEIVGVVELRGPRRLVVTLRNHRQRFIDVTQGWALSLARTDGSSAFVNMKSRESLLITPQKARGEKYADTEIALLPRKLFRRLGNQVRFALDFQYFYGTQSGYKTGDVLILSYQGEEMSRYPEAVQFAPRLQRSITTTWGSMKKPK